jgi:hypothetical protein
MNDAADIDPDFGLGMAMELLARKDAHIAELESRVKCQAERLEQQKQLVEDACRYAMCPGDHDETLQKLKADGLSAYLLQHKLLLAILAETATQYYVDVVVYPPGWRNNEPNSTDAGGTTETGMESAGGGEVDSPDPHPL